MKNDYLNCWLLAKELDQIAKESNDPDLAKLCKLIKENYGYPVDSVLVSKNLKVLDHINVHDFERTTPEGYLSFLKQGLESEGIEPTIDHMPPQERNSKQSVEDEKLEDGKKPRGKIRQPPPMKLTRDQPQGSLLEVIRHEGSGQPSIAFYQLDVSDFAKGGEVEIEVRVGGGDATGRFELCDSSPDMPGAVATVEMIPNLKPGERKTVSYSFAKGGRLVFVAIAPPELNEEGQSNAFLANIKVKVNE